MQLAKLQNTANSFCTNERKTEKQQQNGSKKSNQ